MLTGGRVSQPVSLNRSELGRACVVPPRPLRRGLYQAVECPIATYFLEPGQRLLPGQEGGSSSRVRYENTAARWEVPAVPTGLVNKEALTAVDRRVEPVAPE